MPENRLAVEGRQVVGKTTTSTSGAGCFQVVDQHRDVERRVDINQQMDVIRLTAKLQQLATPCGQNLTERLTQILQQHGSQRPAPVLGHENDM